MTVWYDTAAMSFYTSLIHYRPTRPPVVTGPDLADFVEMLIATGLLAGSGGEYLSLKFGKRIDQDAQRTTWEEPVPGCSGIFAVRTIDWDIEHARLTLSEMSQILRNHDRPLYRASLGLPCIADRITQALQTERSDDEPANVCLGCVGVGLGPVHLATLELPAVAVGWMDVSISGPGYLWPWTPRDLVARAEALPELQALTSACRRKWPVASDAMPGALGKLAAGIRTRRTRAIRKEMGPLYPYDDLDRPWDWMWGVHESG